MTYVTKGQKNLLLDITKIIYSYHILLEITQLLNFSICNHSKETSIPTKKHQKPQTFSSKLS